MLQAEGMNFRQFAYFAIPEMLFVPGDGFRPVGIRNDFCAAESAQNLHPSGLQYFPQPHPGAIGTYGHESRFPDLL